MKSIAVCISGQYRSFDDCYKSIIETFVTSSHDVFVKIFICFSKEDGKYISIPKEIFPYCGKIKIEEDCILPDLSKQIEKYKSSNFKLNQLAGAVSTYYQLLQIKSSFNLMLEYEKEHGIQFDYVARVRPDIKYESKFDWNLSEDLITILKGYDWNGYNDKFAIGHKNPMSKYMTRFDFWMSDDGINTSTHNETNLKLWMDKNNISVNRTNLRYNYVRYNDTTSKKIEIVEITECKVLYKNVTKNELEILLKIYDRNDSLFGEASNYIYYTSQIKIPPEATFFSTCLTKAPNKKMVSIEGKDLYIEHIMI